MYPLIATLHMRRLPVGCIKRTCLTLVNISGCNVGDTILAMQLGNAAVISGWQQHTGTGVQRLVVGGSGQYWHWRPSVRAHTSSLGDSTAFTLSTRARTEALLKPAAQHATCKLAGILIVDEQNFYKPEVQRFNRQRSLYVI